MAGPVAMPDFAERQLPTQGEIYLDHIAHFVPDQRMAMEAMTRAGFAPTPVSIQTNPGPNGTQTPAGTGNITAMMTRGYIEVLFKTSQSPLTKEFDDNLAKYAGAHLIAFAVADAKAASERLATAGFRTAPLVALRRTVGTESGTAEAAFTVARVIPGEMREGRIQYLTHHTEDAVWQKRWLNHPNGANALIDAVIAVEDVDEAASRFTRFLAREAVPTNFGRGFFLDRGGMQLVTAAAFARIAPGIGLAPLPFIGLYAVRVASLTAAERVLRSGGVRFAKQSKTLLAPFPRELGQGAWIFTESAGDLPWRANS
jgi:Glyoxalase-like domain